MVEPGVALETLPRYTGVGVRVKVQHRDPSALQHVGHAFGVRKVDEVVAAEDARDGARARHLLDCASS